MLSVRFAVVAVARVAFSRSAMPQPEQRALSVTHPFDHPARFERLQRLCDPLDSYPAMTVPQPPFRDALESVHGIRVLPKIFGELGANRIVLEVAGLAHGANVSQGEGQMMADANA
jgi:hypothetical protein